MRHTRIQNLSIFLNPFKIVGMSIPSTQRDLNESHIVLYQSPSQQASLPKGIRAVGIP